MDETKMKVLIRIKTRKEIFGCDEFPIIFDTYHAMCHWLTKPDNNNFVEKILGIFDYYVVN